MEIDKEKFKIKYKKYISKKILFMSFCLVVSIIVMGLELSAGKYDIGFFESYNILFDHIKGLEPIGNIPIMKDYVIWELRFPRALAGLAVGAGLGACGAVMQSTLRNPLADPYTTGISAGAGLGAALSIILGFCIIPGIYGELSTIINAFTFALIPAAIIMGISTFKKGTTPTVMILTGVAVMYVFSAITTLLKVTASEESLADVYIWSVGTLGKATWSNIWYMALASIFGIFFMMLLANKINLLMMDDKEVKSFGVSPKLTRLISLLIVSMVTATLVSFTGTIGFVGLVAPHVVRIFIGSDNRYLIPSSAAFGAMLLICSDCVAKEIGSTGLPVGVITALIGGPLFLYLLIRQRKSSW